jgi:hypothetical protein
MDELQEIKSIVGDTIPEVIYNWGLFTWKMHNKMEEPQQPFLVCEYEAFERLCKHFGKSTSQVSHVKATSKKVPYAAFELKAILKVKGKLLS